MPVEHGPHCDGAAPTSTSPALERTPRPAAGTLDFLRGGLRCVVNFGPVPVPVPWPAPALPEQEVRA